MCNPLKILIVALTVFASVLPLPTRAAGAITDLAGRVISLPVASGRILLGEGRLLRALAILGKTPVERVVGMMSDFERLDPAGYAQYRAVFPALDQVARVGRTTGASFSVEQAIALAPQVAIFELGGHGPAATDHTLIGQLERAGITVVFVDFSREPLRNTTRSMAVLGAVLGHEEAAREFIDVYTAEMARVADAPAGGPMPSAFIEARVGLSDECCPTMSNGMMGRFVARAAGRNVASDLIPGSYGVLSIEYLLERQPDIYIGTAIGAVATAGAHPTRIVLGASVDADTARASLRRALARSGIADLSAVKHGRAHALWHHFTHSPFNVVAVQVIAKWLYPERYADLDPARTLRTLYARFQPVPLTGVYWIDGP